MRRYPLVQARVRKAMYCDKPSAWVCSAFLLSAGGHSCSRIPDHLLASCECWKHFLHQKNRSQLHGLWSCVVTACMYAQCYIEYALVSQTMQHWPQVIISQSLAYPGTEDYAVGLRVPRFRLWSAISISVQSTITACFLFSLIINPAT